MRDSSIHLIGGGWDPEHAATVYGPFLAEALAVSESDGRVEPNVACVVLDEGDGLEQFARWDAVLRSIAPCRPAPVLVELGGAIDVRALGAADGLLVCGGLTPGYAAALAPAGPEIRTWLRQGNRPYAGFSAGAAIAAASALVGGWLSAGVPICPEDAAEDLTEISLEPGLALVPAIVDVHCAQWGTLPRLIEAIRSRPELTGVGIDESTVLIIGPDAAIVHGNGTVWRVAADGDAVVVSPFRDNDPVPL